MSDSLRDTFFAECEELLEAMAEGLRAMSEGTDDEQTINAVFRAVHSIKGAAGAFALNDLVKFAHRFETVLDLIRSNVLKPDADGMRVLQRAGDVLTDLVDSAQSGNEVRGETVDTVREGLDGLIELAPGSDEPEEEVTFEPMGFSAMPILDLGPPPDETWEITFRPLRGLYENGHEPLHLFAALADLGPLESSCDTSQLPPLSEIDPEESYLSWTLGLTTSASEGEIREVFAFVEGLCDLTIRPLTGHDPDGEEEPSFRSRRSSVEAAPAGQVTHPAPAAPSASAAQQSVPAKAASAPVAEAAPESRAAAQAAPRQTLRVDPERVDRLINSVGELIINQAVIAQKIAEAGLPPSAEIMTDLDDYKLLAREIQESVMAIRAQPVKPLFQRMARIVREAAEATGKIVIFETEGEATEVDKTVVERLADPLTHMVRNAIDHGIEVPEKRRAVGKPEGGTLRLAASHRSGNVLIEIHDDGAGLNRDRIRETAVRKGLIPEEANLSESEIDNLLFLPGFSTASTVTNLSGRGVGMDVVKTTITSLGGRISIASRPGQGSVFSISLPLTLAVLDGMIVRVAGQTMVLPISSILETIRPTVRDLTRIGQNGHLLSIRGTYVPIIDLAEILGHGGGDFDPTNRILVLVRTEGKAQAALAVEDISDQRQVVIKSLSGNYGAIPGISAATILGNGKIALIIDPDAAVSLSAVQSRPQAFMDIDKEPDHDHAA